MRRVATAALSLASLVAIVPQGFAQDPTSPSAPPLQTLSIETGPAHLLPAVWHTTGRHHPCSAKCTLAPAPLASSRYSSMRNEVGL